MTMFRTLNTLSVFIVTAMKTTQQQQQQHSLTLEAAPLQLDVVEPGIVLGLVQHAVESEDRREVHQLLLRRLRQDVVPLRLQVLLLFLAPRFLLGFIDFTWKKTNSCRHTTCMSNNLRVSLVLDYLNKIPGFKTSDFRIPDLT